MGFGTELQGKASHDALLRFHDTEIRLLENIKRCVSLRVDSDRRYTVSLGGMIQQAHKIDTAEFSPMCNVFKAWDAFVKQSEEMVRQIKQNIEDLSSRTLEKLTLLISDKKATRKFYVEEKSRLEGEFTKIQDEVQKNKEDYSKIRGKLRPDQVKYEDMYYKGKPGTRFEDTKIKFVKNSVKLHKCHNEYVLSLRDVNIHQESYLSTNLPSLLDHHQATQELVVEQCKELFEDIHQLTNLSSPEFHRLSEIVSESIRNIQSDTEYQEFIGTYKTEPIKVQTFEFDSMLLDDYNGKLVADTITLDDLTHEMLGVKKAEFDDRLAELRKTLEEKQKSHTELEETLTQIARESDTDVKNNNDYIVNKRAKLILKKQMTELQSSISKYEALHKMGANLLTELGDETPPSGLELLHLPAAAADSLDTTSTVSSTSSINWKKKLQNANPFRRYTNDGSCTDLDKRVSYEQTDPHNGGLLKRSPSSSSNEVPYSTY